MSTGDDELILVGVVARPHGLRGEVAVNAETDFADRRFAPGATLLAGPEGATQLRVEHLRFHQGRPLVTFEGVEGVEQARQLAGTRLWIRAGQRDPLPAGQYYHSDLVGCLVEDVAGHEIGRVTRIDDTAGMTMLVIVRSAGQDEREPIRQVRSSPGRDRPGQDRGEVLVPLVDDICREIDVTRQRIVIAPPEGLLDLNG